MRLNDFSSYELPYFDDTTSWIVTTNSHTLKIKPGTTSFFLANKSGSVESLHNNIFQSSEQLHVLKLCCCTFSFSSPPFLHCTNIRFLGLDSCKDQGKTQEENKEVEEKDIRKVDFFQSLWVLDICYTDWELNLSPNILERVVISVRDVSIKRGRIWNSTCPWTWRHLQNVHKLRVIEPTCPWESDSTDQFTGMVKLEFLDLSGNIAMQVLPSLAGATGLKSLVLDGCTGLKHVLLGTLPPSLETFSFDAGAGKRHNREEAKISHISMAGCSRLVNFRLRGSLGNLEELDLSDTLIKALDLRDEVVQVPCLQRVILLGCKLLRVVLWPEEGTPKLTLLCVDTRGGQVARSETSHGSLVCEKQGEYCHACVSVTDLRFIQSLKGISADFNLNLFLTCSKDDGQSYTKDKMVPCSAEQSAGSALRKSLIPWTHQIYIGMNVDKATIDIHGSNARQFEPLDVHVDIGEGISNSNVVTAEAVEAVVWLMDNVKSLQVHDNSFMITVTPMIPGVGDGISWDYLKSCRVERCSKLDTVFTNDRPYTYFPELETFWAVDLLMARSIWSKRTSDYPDESFKALRAVHIRFCPRLTFVLPLPWSSTCCLEILQIICCGDLTHVFPAEAEILNEISTDPQEGVLEFPNLKHIYLYELPKLQQICEAKMFAPSLETITVRGCWSLKRLPVTNLSSEGDRSDNRPVVDCEKDWWEKLEWDGKEQGHHYSLFKPRHSKYYKKIMLRGTVLR